MPTYYEVLGCDKNASYDELKKRYHEKAKKCHPDKSGKGSEIEFDLLNKAWKTLGNSETRREYDLTIGKSDLDEMPLYCVVSLGDMDFDQKTNAYNYSCRCGGVYTLTADDLHGFEKLKVPCDECTFHIVVLVDS